MRALPGLITLLAALLVLTPFVSASTFEAWTEGLYDAESDASQAVKSADGVVEYAPLRPFRYVPIVAGLVANGDDLVAPVVLPPAPPGRAPPAA